MIVDNKLTFNTDWATPQAISTSSNVDSTGIIDLTGAGSGTAPAIISGFPAANTAVGLDIGAGDGVARPYLYVTVTTAGSTTANTLTINLEAAPDDGSYGQGTYTTIYTSAAVQAQLLVKGSTLIVPVPPTLFNWPSEAKPRFYKLNYVASGALTVSVLAGIILNPPSNLLQGKYANNFAVA